MVEHFFRDAGSPGQRFLGLKTPAPLWTAEAFHCCLLIALVYPLAMIFLIWTVSGDVGPAEATLGLPSNLAAWHRVATLVAFTVSVLGYWGSQRTAGWKTLVWFIVCVLAGIAVAISLTADTADIAGAIAVTGAVVGAVAGDVAVAVVGSGIGAVVGAIALGVAGTFVGTVAGFATVAVVAIVARTTKISVTRGRKAGFWLLFLLVMIVACLGGAALLSL